MFINNKEKVMTVKENQKKKVLKAMDINPSGKFKTWNPSRLEELEKKEFSNDLGQKIIFENEYQRIWEVVLLPKERLPFRVINKNYCWVACSEGMVISRFADGKIILMHLEKGDSEYMEHKDKPAIYDLENIGEEIIWFQLTEHKSEPTFENKKDQKQLENNSTQELK